MANVTTVTFDYILDIVFLFLLNVGVSPSFHCTVLVSVTGCLLPVSIIQWLVPVTGYVLPACIMEVLLLVSI